MARAGAISSGCRVRYCSLGDAGRKPSPSSTITDVPSVADNWIRITPAGPATGVPLSCSVSISFSRMDFHPDNANCGPRGDLGGRRLPTMDESTGTPRIVKLSKTRTGNSALQQPLEAIGEHRKHDERREAHGDDQHDAADFGSLASAKGYRVAHDADVQAVVAGPGLLAARARVPRARVAVGGDVGGCRHLRRGARAVVGARGGGHGELFPTLETLSSLAMVHPPMAPHIFTVVWWCRSFKVPRT
ncbi:hypothetical protein ON010_g5946 [Phytophthora cinnamomi]|nr:hypothetical protein ON010_g5946 [Phytophthora cinnamomi]